MSTELYRVGDLVFHTLGYDNGRSIEIYAKVIDIVDKNNVSYYEYDIVTGCGARNSKVEIIISALAYVKDLSYCDKGEISLDPHKVHKVNIDRMRAEIDSKVKFLGEKMTFININENRIDKLDKILNDKQ